MLNPVSLEHTNGHVPESTLISKYVNEIANLLTQARVMIKELLIARLTWESFTRQAWDPEAAVMIEGSSN